MLHRIRIAMTDRTSDKLGGDAPIECDETFVGGNVRNRHKSKRALGVAYQGGVDKVIVMGMLERGGRIRAGVIADRKLPNMRPMMAENIHPGSHIITDEFQNYARLAKESDHLHEVIEHATEYVRGHIHTNGVENFWALLKRGLHGTYVSVDAAHLNSYVAEQVFRFNLRKDHTDAQRFKAVLKDIVGRRLTYAELTGRLKPAA